MEQDQARLGETWTIAQILPNLATSLGKIGRDRQIRWDWQNYGERSGEIRRDLDQQQA